MAQKYAIYKLSKLPGGKEYTPMVKSIEKSLSAAYDEMQSYYDDCLDGPVWFNRKIGEFVAYEIDERMLYVPNFDIRNGEMVLKGVYGRLPLYYVDRYPNPYARYRLRKDGDQLILEGIKG